MASAPDLIESAFRRLSARPGYTSRPDQAQLSRLLGDLIEERVSGAFEAPTGLGKSLAALVPAIAHGLAKGRRTVIATYTNILAEQYWRKDRPLALGLFDEADSVRTELLMGRGRYACLLALEEHAPQLSDLVRGHGGMGTEAEFRHAIARPAREATALWQKVSAPPVCPARMCPAYEECFYFEARRRAEAAHVVITNHSVVLMDAILKRAAEGGAGLLGEYDFLILDEAHDFAHAAASTLEFELSANKLLSLMGVVGRIEASVLPLAERADDAAGLRQCVSILRDRLEAGTRDLAAFGTRLGRPGILEIAPGEVAEHPQVRHHRARTEEGAKQVADGIGEALDDFVKAIKDRVTKWREADPERIRQASESLTGYLGYLGEYAAGCRSMFRPTGVSVSYVGQPPGGVLLRHDIIDLVEPLRELIWDRVPSACLSATLAVDGSFDFFRRGTGAEPKFEEILPSPFDFATQAAVYMPPAGQIPDPTAARRDGYEPDYFAAVARELAAIIQACGGRTLALFHSRREMEEVASRMNLPPEFPILVQRAFGVATVGERFRSERAASLFALRSFWTGFDAPGETLSCVALVRVPFEVPIDPPQIARLAYLQSQGRDAFGEHTLPNAKMMMRQGAGRLIRSTEDKGVIALLDPRLQTKRYGDEILENLPPGMRVFRSIDDAVGFVGI